MSSKSLFDQKTLANIKKIHKGFLWGIVGVLIASLLLGAIVIFIDTKNDVFGKVQGTFVVLALAAFISINNLIRIEKGDKTIQCFALGSFFMNIIWLIVAILMIWGALSPLTNTTSTAKMDNEAVRTYDRYERYDSDVLNDANTQDEYSDYDYEYDDYGDYDYGNYDYEYDDYDYDYDYDYDDYDYDESNPDYNLISNYGGPSSDSLYGPTTINISIATKLLVIASCLAAIGFWASNILAIKDRVKAIFPLKIAAIVCQVFSSVFIIVLVCIWPVTLNQDLFKWASLYALTSSGFIVMALAAWIISRTHRDFDLVSSVVLNQDKDGSDFGIKKDEFKAESISEKLEKEEEVNKSDSVKEPLEKSEFDNDKDDNDKKDESNKSSFSSDNMLNNRNDEKNDAIESRSDFSEEKNDEKSEHDSFSNF